MPMPNTVEEYQSYNEYYNFTKKQTTAYVDESQLPNASGGVGINHNPDIQKGVYYVQCPSTGWKTSGKETHITTFSDEAVEGYDYNVNGKTDGSTVRREIKDTSTEAKSMSSGTCSFVT